MKTAITFETKLLAYGAALRELDAADAAVRKNPGSVAARRRVNLAITKVDKLRGPMMDAMNRLARAAA